jgi:HEPN domain-containing protein
MTKAEVRKWLRRAREGIRDAEQALLDGSAEDLLFAVQEIGGSAAEIEGAVTSDYSDARGVNGLE